MAQQKKMLMKGTEAIAEAAIGAGCRFFFGYPITPQNEIPEYMSKRLPQIGGTYLQAESEVSAINMLYGARSREVKSELSHAGIGVIAPPGALANSDLPILSPELRGAVARSDLHVVLDVGGDPVGARALGSISDVMSAADYDLLLVLNRHRPFMDDKPKVIDHARQIIGATRIKVTGVISNTHMMDETSMHDVLWGLELARDVAAELAVDVRLLGMPQHLTEEAASRTDLPPVIAIRRHLLPSFLGGFVLAQSKSETYPAEH